MGSIVYVFADCFYISAEKQGHLLPVKPDGFSLKPNLQLYFFIRLVEYYFPLLLHFVLSGFLLA